MESRTESGKIRMIKLDKVKAELQNFWDEIVVENGPRYRDWRNWGHLWIDFWASLFSMSYTLGHIVGIGLPAAAVIAIIT